MEVCSRVAEEEKKLNTSEKPKNKETNLNEIERDKKTTLRLPDDKRTLGKCALLLSNKVGQYLEEQVLVDKGKLRKRSKIAMFDNQVVNSSLIRARREGDLEIEKELINCFGLSYIKRWSDGYVLLCQALITKKEIAKLFLNQDCKVNHENGKRTDTPFHLTVISGDLEVIEMVLDKDADVNARDIYGKNPLHLAASSRCSQTVVECLLKFGAHFNIRNNNGESPINLVALYGHPKIIEYLLKLGADVNIRNEVIESPIYFAAFF
ncbi:26S proteasome non-ATPase regulatory subunit 10-like [Artemia franciscana]|uniref:26S proteasome non-ATPase regulatory subunit 10-like n=1 Tax=Artemia franciscana TaxID=6661 RepID=UPI0032DB2407